MRIYVIYNPKAGTAKLADALRERLGCRSDVTWAEPTSATEARQCAAEAQKADYDLLVAAGGDGTLHEVVNGLAPAFAGPRLAVLPLGTGNDLRRTLAIPDDPLEALTILDSGSERLIDIIQVETATLTTYCVNVAAGGFSGQMQEAMTEEMKQTWGPLSYLRGAMGVLPELTQYQTHLQLDGGHSERVEALNIVVANGRFAAKGWEVASQANPEDGLLEVVVVRHGPLLDLTAVGAQLVAGDYLKSDMVLHYKARRIHIQSEPGMWFSIDGELLTNEPVTFSVKPRALRVLVGPNYSPVPPAPQQVA